MDIVKVKCFDMSYSRGVWSRKDMGNFGLIDLEVVGWLVEEREDCIILADEYQPEDDQFRHITAISKACIKEIKKVGKR